MGYTNETTHYSIPLPTGSDLTTPMDYNEAMQDVDTALFAAKSDSDSALSKAEDLEVALGQTNDDLTALAGRVTTAEGTISDQGLALTSLGNKVDDNYADTTDAICAYKEATATASRNYAVGDYFWYNDVLYRATVAITAGQTIVPDTNCTTTNVMTEVKTLANGADDFVEICSVTGDGVMTQSEALTTLYGLIGNTGLSHTQLLKCKIALFPATGTTGDFLIHSIADVTDTDIRCSSIFASGTSTVINTADLRTSLSRRERVTIANDGTITITDLSSPILPATAKFALVK